MASKSSDECRTSWSIAVEISLKEFCFLSILERVMDFPLADFHEVGVMKTERAASVGLNWRSK